MRQNNNCDVDDVDVVVTVVVTVVVVVEDGRRTTINARMDMISRTATIQVHTNRCWNGGDGILLVVMVVCLQSLLDLDSLAIASGMPRPPTGPELAKQQKQQLRGIKTFPRPQQWGLASE